jgi:hypothetical protein
MLTKYFENQKGNVPIATNKGIQFSNDTTLPYQTPRWQGSNYLFHREQIIYPANNIVVFTGGVSDPIRFSVSTSDNIVTPLNEMKFSFKIRIRTSPTTLLTKLDAANKTYCSVTNLNASNGALVSGTSSSTSSTVSAIYLRNSCAPFKLFEIKDRTSGKLISSIQYPGLYAQAMLSGSSPFFYDASAGLPEAMDYASSVHTFRDPAWYWQPVTTASGSYYSVPTPTAMPLLFPEAGAGSTRTMVEVQKQQMSLFPSDQTASYDDGSDVYFIPIDHLLQTPMKLPTRWCPLLFEFTLDQYANAIVDVLSTYNSTNGWTVGNNNTGAWNFELFDCKLVITKFFLQVSEVPKIVAQLEGGGIELPYTQLQYLEVPFLASQNSFDLQINLPQYQNLERVIVTTRFTPDTNQVSQRDKYYLRNGSDIFGSGQRNQLSNTQTVTPTFNYNTGNLCYSCDTSGNIITNPATNPSGGLFWESRNYNGLWKIQLKWLSEQLVRESDFIYIKPWKFRNIRDYTKECFAKCEEHECEIQSYQYDGIDPVSLCWQNSNSSFFFGFSFVNLPGSEQSGISLVKSPLDIYVWKNTSNNVPTNVTDLTMDCFALFGTVINWSLSGMSLST